jgi:hypothetical protein
MPKVYRAALKMSNNRLLAGLQKVGAGGTAKIVVLVLPIK